jgi:hypothetical protein
MAMPQAVVTPAPSLPATEPVVGIIPGVQRRKGLLGVGNETFNLILTPSRLVFAAVTSQMMKEAAASAQQEARNQGKGLLGQWGAQLGWLNVICRRYETMPVETILAQHSGSFFLPNAGTRRVRVKESLDDETARSTSEVIIETTGGKYRFELTAMGAREAKRLLQQTLGKLVR